MKKVFVSFATAAAIAFLSSSVNANFGGWAGVISGGSWHDQNLSDTPDGTCGTNCVYWDVGLSSYCDDVDEVEVGAHHDGSSWYFCNWLYTEDNGSSWETSCDTEECNLYNYQDEYYFAVGSEDNDFSGNDLCVNDWFMKLLYKQTSLSLYTYAQQYKM